MTMDNKKIKIGTRGSELALWQTEYVIEKLRASAPAVNFEFEIVKIKTQADEDHSVPVMTMGGKGVFIKEIEEALLSRQVDLAVHSLKDLASEPPQGLSYFAYWGDVPRGDVLISREPAGIHDLPKGARVGTGSPRRIAQLESMRPDLAFHSVRGNIATRLKKLDRGECDVLILAEAGLLRLGFDSRITYRFSPDELVPAGGQGIIALEGRTDDLRALSWTRKREHEEAALAARIEFKFLALLHAGCRTPLGIHVRIDGNYLHVYVFLRIKDDGFTFKSEQMFPMSEAAKIAGVFEQNLRKEYYRKTSRQMDLTKI